MVYKKIPSESLGFFSFIFMDKTNNVKGNYRML